MSCETTYPRIVKTEEESVAIAAIEDYSKILDHYGLSYSKANIYLQVGEIVQTQGWILHISVIRSQIVESMHKIIPFLTSCRLAFKVVRDRSTAINLLNGNLGNVQIGKIFSVYPSEDQDLAILANDLIKLTEGLRGPTILTDILLGGNIYTRYGSFNPMLLDDGTGVKKRYIYNSKKELEKDDYAIPFSVPEGIEWPFGAIASPDVPPEKKMLKSIYKPISLLKSDSKGDVIKALYPKNIFAVSWCVIKQGRKNMWSDDLGRDIPDRLIWQKDLFGVIEGIIPTPKIMDIFTENGDTFLVMEYIKGIPLSNKVHNLNRHCVTWASLSNSSKLEVTDYILQIIHILELFHEKGLVHRDITSVNFIVNKKGRLLIIDNELAYSLDKKTPEPPYELGTYGFMSPEQIAGKIPTPSEDIYGLGATIIALLTGLSPLTFSINNMGMLTTNLRFFFSNTSLAQVIALCLNPNPALRPSLITIKRKIQSLKTEIESNNSGNYASPLDKTVEDPSQLRLFINASIKGLVNPPTMFDDGFWYSRSSLKDNINAKENFEFSKSVGLYEGIAGVLYMLARARKLELNIVPCREAYIKSLEYLQMSYLQYLPDVGAGLVSGAAGIALAITNGIDAEILEYNKENLSIISQCLSISSNEVNLAMGSAGQAIALMQCRTYLPLDLVNHLTTTHVNTVLENIGKNWNIRKSKSDIFNAGKGFKYGDTGIIWMLLKYSNEFDNPSVKTFSMKLAESCRHTAVQLKKVLKQNGCRKLFDANFNIFDTYLGIVLVNMQAYEISKDKRYQRETEDLLSVLPEYIVHDNFSQDSGLSVLGEIYLEAYLVFKNVEWMRRAGWIAKVLIHTAQIDDEGNCCWQGNNSRFPTADLLVGNSGIIHFLMRYLAPNKLGFRTLR